LDCFLHPWRGCLQWKHHATHQQASLVYAINIRLVHTVAVEIIHTVAVKIIHTVAVEIQGSVRLIHTVAVEIQLAGVKQHSFSCVFETSVKPFWDCELFGQRPAEPHRLQAGRIAKNHFWKTSSRRLLRFSMRGNALCIHTGTHRHHIIAPFWAPMHDTWPLRAASGG